MEIVKEIESAAHLRFTGIVNNSNLGYETKIKHILDSQNYADQISRAANIPVLFTSVRKDLAEEVQLKLDNPVFPIEIVHKPGWFID